MAKPKGSEDSSDHDKCNKMIDAMVHLLRKQQIAIQYLTEGKKRVEEIVKLEHARWASEVDLLKDLISRMKTYLAMQEKDWVVETLKAHMDMCLKSRECHLYKKKFEDADSFLVDFRKWFELLSQKCREKDTSANMVKIGERHRYRVLENNLTSLQSENEKLMLDKNSEISALLAEKNFVWNQYKLMETNLNEQLRQKRADVESANAKILGLLSSMEDMQSSNSLKDRTIERLNNDISRLKSNSEKKDEEVSRLSRELEALKKSRNESATPVLRCCRTESGNTRSKGMSGITVTTKKELDFSPTLQKGSKTSKRKAVDTIHVSGTPKLFTSSFKVPKLKNPSPTITSH